MNNIQVNDYEISDIMKESEKLYSRYRALVYWGPLQPRPINTQSQIELRNVVFSYIKVQSKHKDRARHSGLPNTVNITCKKLTIKCMIMRYL